MLVALHRAVQAGEGQEALGKVSQMKKLIEQWLSLAIQKGELNHQGGHAIELFKGITEQHATAAVRSTRAGGALGMGTFDV